MGCATDPPTGPAAGSPAASTSDPQAVAPSCAVTNGRPKSSSAIPV